MSKFKKRLLPLFIGVSAGGTLGLTSLSVGAQLAILLGLALLYFPLAVTWKLKKAFKREVQYPVVDEARLDDGMRAAARELEKLGYSRAPVVHGPTGSNYRPDALMLLLFNEECTQVATVCRLCGPLSVVIMSFFEEPSDESRAPFMMTGSAPSVAASGPDEMVQIQLGADIATMNTMHGATITWLGESGVEARSMRIEDVLASLKISIARGMKRVGKAPLRFTMGTMGRSLFRKSLHLGPIQEQEGIGDLVNYLAKRE